PRFGARKRRHLERSLEYGRSERALRRLIEGRAARTLEIRDGKRTLEMKLPWFPLSRQSPGLIVAAIPIIIAVGEPAPSGEDALGLDEEDARADGVRHARLDEEEVAARDGVKAEEP